MFHTKWCIHKNKTYHETQLAPNYYTGWVRPIENFIPAEVKETLDILYLFHLCCLVACACKICVWAVWWVVFLHIYIFLPSSSVSGWTPVNAFILNSKKKARNIPSLFPTHQKWLSFSSYWLQRNRKIKTTKMLWRNYFPVYEDLKY